MRLGAAIALVAGALGLVALPAGSAEAKPAQQYVVRADLRLCPSPLCGGYWVALANNSRTRCHDGLYRPRCYVASAWPASRTIHDGALVRGGIGAEVYQGFGTLGKLVATQVRNPVGAAASGSFYRLRDLGIRCVREPCFSIRASRLNRLGAVALSDLDLGAIDLTLEQRAIVALELARDGLFAAGRVASVAGGGRIFRASRIYLREPKPRA